MESKKISEILSIKLIRIKEMTLICSWKISIGSAQDGKNAGLK